MGQYYTVNRPDYREVIGSRVKIIETTIKDHHKEDKAIYNQEFVVLGSYKDDRDLIMLEPIKPYFKNLKHKSVYVFITSYAKHADMGKLILQIL